MYLAAALSVGILVAGACHVRPGTFALLITITLAVGLTRALRRRAAPISEVLLAFALLGGYAASLEMVDAPNSLARIVSAENFRLHFEATVLDEVPRRRGDEAAKRYLVRVTKVFSAAGGVPVSGNVYLDAPMSLPLGARLDCKVLCWKPGPPVNPGGFDYRAYLERRGVAFHTRAPYEGLVEVMGLSRAGRITRAVRALRRDLVRRLELVGLAESGIVPAVLVADRSGISEETFANFRQSGTMHLLAISGLHVGVVVGLVWWVVQKLGGTLATSSVAGVVAAGFYAVVAGGRPPVVRAALMAGLICLAILIYRKARTLSVISTVALVMLVFRPLDLFDPGFQLSFAAVLGLCCLGAPLSRWLCRLAGEADTLFASAARGALTLLGWSLGAWLGVGPLVAYYFKMLTPVSPLANIVLIPVASVMVISGLLGVWASFLSVKLGTLLALPARGAEMALGAAAGWLGALPGAYVHTGAVSALSVVGAMVFLAWMAARTAAGKRVAGLVIAALVVTNLFLWHAALGGQNDSPRLETLVSRSGAAMVFFDGRGHTAVFLSRAGDEDFARFIISPFLLERGVAKVDLLVETAGADARIGAVIASQFKLGSVFRQRRFRGNALPGTTSTYFGPGDRLEAFGATRISFHSGRAKDYQNPAELYFEGLVCEIESAGTRAIVALDATLGCLYVVKDHIEPEAAIVSIVAPHAPQPYLQTWTSAFAPQHTVLADPSDPLAHSTAATLADPVEIRPYRH